MIINGIFWLKIVGTSIARFLTKRGMQANLVHVHLAYEELQAVFCNLSVILSLAWKDELESDHERKVKEKIESVIKSQPNITTVCSTRLVGY